jgi:hypothetical protein
LEEALGGKRRLSTMKFEATMCPDHYEMEITPIQFIQANDLDFCQGNVIKYVCRYKKKGGMKDLRKAQQYIKFMINKLKGDGYED